MHNTKFIFTAVLFLLMSCRQANDHQGRTLLVEVEGNYLYLEDLHQALPTGLSSKDSTAFADHFIRNWVEDILLYEKAKRNIPNNTTIDQLVENYRRSLIGHAYQQELINQQLSEEIPEDEILAYYEKHQDLFISESPLLKGLFIKVPLSANQLAQVRKWYKDSSQESVDQLEKYSLQNAVSYEYFYNKWLSVTEVSSMLPLQKASDTDYFASHRHIELRDTAFCYFLNVSDYRPAGLEEPYEQAQSKAKEMLINQKKADFMKQVKEELYQRAVKQERIKYNNKKE